MGVQNACASRSSELQFIATGKGRFGKEGQGVSQVFFWIATFRKPIGHLSGDVG